MNLPQSFLGAGDVYIDVLTGAGVSTGLARVGNATALSIQANAELKQQMSKGRADYGQLIASVNLPSPHNLNITFNQLDPTVLAMAWLGTQSAVSVTGSTVVAEEITAKLDKYVELAYRGISAVTVNGDGGTPTYVLDTDYSLNTRNGWVMPLATGSISEDDVLEVSYTYASATGYKVIGANQPSIRVGVRFDGVNLNNSKNCLLKIYAAQLNPTSAIDLLADDFSGAEFEGLMITPTGMATPYEYYEFD